MQCLSINLILLSEIQSVFYFYKNKMPKFLASGNLISFFNVTFASPINITTKFDSGLPSSSSYRIEAFKGTDPSSITHLIVSTELSRQQLTDVFNSFLINPQWNIPSLPMFEIRAVFHLGLVWPLPAPLIVFLPAIAERLFPFSEGWTPASL